MDIRQETLSIEGMSCGHCVSAVERALSEIEGVQRCEVAIGSATIGYDPDRVDNAEVDRAIEEAGFTVTGRAAA